MYEVTIINEGQETVIHSPYVNNTKLTNGQIKQQINKIDSFDLEFTLNNPAYGKMKPFQTYINVLNMLTNKYEFEGRVLAPSDSMSDSGMFANAYKCEGELSYLHDSQQKHVEYRGTPRQLLQQILEYHNQQVEPYKHFQIGEVTITNSTDNLYVYLSAENDTYDTIFDKLIDRIGGELQIRKDNDIRYLDLLEKVGIDSNTEIRIAKNLRSITRDRNPTEIITRLTPLGTRIESEDEEATDASEARLTIEEVNNGIPYIDAPELIAEFGIQGGSQTWDDVTIASNLLNIGRNWLRDQKTSYTKYDVNVVDLSIIGQDDDSFSTGNSYPVYNPIMGIDERLRVIGKSININAPEADSLTIGDKFRTLEEYQAEAQKSARKVQDLENTVESQSRRIATIQNEFSTVENNMENLQQIIENADIPGLEGAISSLEQSISDLNEALDSIPIYEPATSTQDGLMSASDKSKLDRIRAQNNINLDLITITQAINLDQLYQDVQELKNS
ncbi:MULTISPECIES: phage tail spike protein [unclassified Oceanobacillus]|uniref:phage tail spike protein n=1 Tax=unclassified Oceanobacillus TaxID=2630292 RepID=UPI001BED09BB|nr:MULTISPECIES: phage tail spike protein [unclassified Oceanobacillus]MBT2601429.1 phage tail protein [Oceanobacillus sp. ISL-74]MBT2653294.1 phage tail protein [Oceanobacillus sp. ISL-73]